MNKVVVTGGCGYIGSHTIVDLYQKGYEVISIDDLSRSDGSLMNGVEKILGKKIKNYNVDLCNIDNLKAVFEENNDVVGVVHFAAYKSVPESIEEPLSYYRNNINSLLNLLFCCKKFDIDTFVFSSSCSVYGNLEKGPVSEESPLGKVECPYAYTKQMGEQILNDFAKTSNVKCFALRYFNPVGAHKSHLIGEKPYGAPGNLFPIIMETALFKRKSLFIYGDDYNTKDGSCVRDFIHVEDIAEAHSLALKKLSDDNHKKSFDVINLGTGNGITIIEVIKCFEETLNKRLNYSIGPRRPGDIPMIFANNDKAKKVLGWEPKRDLATMLLSAYNWAKTL